MHIGSDNQNYKYEFLGSNHEIEPVDSVRDLGILVSCDLKWSDQCKQADTIVNYFRYKHHYMIVILTKKP